MTKKAQNSLQRAFQILQEEGAKMLFKKALQRTKELFILPYAIVKIKSLRRDMELHELIDFCFNHIGGLIKPIQVHDEILELLRIVGELKPKVVIEIGTAAGGTLFLFSRIAAEDATLISIDLPGGQFGGGYPTWKIPLFNAFKLPKQQLFLIRADSHDPETLKKVETALNTKKIDFLFIDGDHSYEGVRRDFEQYSHQVKKEGIVAFHDIVVHSPESGCEVSRLWSELKERDQCSEIIKDKSQKKGGIGILIVNNKK